MTTCPMNRLDTENWINRPALACIATCATLLLSPSVNAAQDGAFGLQSSGSIAVSLKIEQGVQITDLEDWSLIVSRDNTGSDFEFVKDFCVRGTVGSRISVTAWTETIVGNQFALSSFDNESMPFHLEFNPEIATGQFEEISPNSGSSVYSINSYNNCETGNNSEIRIVFEEEDIMSASSLEFAGDLFITVELL